MGVTTVKESLLMKVKVLRLIIRITKVSEKLKSVTEDLDKISEMLQDPEILSVIGFNNDTPINTQDYD
jgi:hypothetical protein